MNISVPLRERVLSAAAAAPSLTRRQGRRLAGVLVALSGAIAFALFAAAGGLAPARAPALVGGRLAEGWGLAAAAFAYLVLGRGRSTVVRSPQLLEAATWASPVVVWLWVVRFDGGEASLRDAVTTVALTLGMAATPLASFLVLRRGAEPQCPRTLGAAAGAMCGACAQVAVFLCRPVTGIAFAGVAHVLPLVVLAIAGGMAGDRLLGLPAGTQSPRISPSRGLAERSEDQEGLAA